MLRTSHVREPQLLFAHGKAAIDPRLGMLAHGPAGLGTASHQNGVIRIGAIGTPKSLAQLRGFLARFMHPWAAEADTLEEPWRVEFPGLGAKGPLGFEFQVDPNCVQQITDEELKAVLAVEPRAARVEAVLALYKTKLSDLEAVALKPASLIVFPLPEEIIARCKDPNTEGNKIMVGRRNVPNEEWEDAETNNFHHALKALTFPLKIPCQLLQPTTMRFEGTQDAATVAWNLATGMYYKATGHPWKLADIDDGTCIVGISFYREPSKQGSSMRASMAHVYFRSMESQVIRGKPFAWQGEHPNQEPTLTEAQAEDLLRDVLNFFGRLRKTEGLPPTPTRVVVHKSSPFTEDEIAGLDAALPAGTAADYVSIDGGRSVRFFHAESGYPPLRGTMVYDDPRDGAFLYTTGFVPALRTYPGSSVPAPIGFRAARLDTSLDQVAADLMALTRLDWNSTDFCTRQPVTISVSRKVGSILSEARARNLDPPAPYRFYM
ncbi:MAG: argonaute/piwi family protein [Thermoplasmatota archaeon]